MVYISLILKSAIQTLSVLENDDEFVMSVNMLICRYLICSYCQMLKQFNKNNNTWKTWLNDYIFSHQKAQQNFKLDLIKRILIEMINRCKTQNLITFLHAIKACKTVIKFYVLQYAATRMREPISSPRMYSPMTTIPTPGSAFTLAQCYENKGLPWKGSGYKAFHHTRLHQMVFVCYSMG